jgi:hypothetical protein
MNVATLKYEANFHTDYKVRFKRNLAITGALAIYLFLFTENSIFINGTLLLSCFSFVRLIFSIGISIPVKEVTEFLMVIQLLLMPYLDYELLQPKGISTMVVDQEMYFDYAFPAVFFFYIGLNIGLGKNRMNYRQVLNRQLSDEQKNAYQKVGWRLIAVGYFFVILKSVTTVPGLEFVTTVLQLFRFVGLFYLWLAGSRYIWIGMILVLLPTTIDTVRSSVFIDLIVWLFFVYAFAAIKLKIKTWVTILLFVGVGFFLIILQSVKVQYRQLTWKESLVAQEKEGVSLFGDLVGNRFDKLDAKSFGSMQTAMINRMNQGWIVSLVIKRDAPTMARERKFFIVDEIAGIFLPRIIYPDKPVVGDNSKFRFLTGFPLATTVAMNVGILGDGYGNFGYTGGLAFCFVFGLLVNCGITYFLKLSGRIPTLICWMPLIFFYVMRAGNEFYIITNWAIKVSLIVAVYYFLSKHFQSQNSSLRTT